WHQHFGIGCMVVPGILAEAAPYFDCVAETIGGYQSHARALGLKRGVGGYGRAMNEMCHTTQKCRDLQSVEGSGAVHCIQNRCCRVCGGTGYLEHVELARRASHDHVGERPPDIYAYTPSGVCALPDEVLPHLAPLAPLRRL